MAATYAKDMDPEKRAQLRKELGLDKQIETAADNVQQLTVAERDQQQAQSSDAFKASDY